MPKIMYIKVTERFTAEHRWKKAPAKEGHLQNFHKHQFTVIVTLKTETSRQTEFWQFKRELRNLLQNNFHDQRLEWSCEEIAQRLWKLLSDRSHKPLDIEVWEDLTSSGGVREV